MNVNTTEMFVVCVIERSRLLEIRGIPGITEREIPLQWSNDMIGAMPVFSNKAAAQRYANGRQVLHFVVERATTNAEVIKHE